MPDTTDVGAGTAAGTVSLLQRFPVKSMLGERHTALDIDARGVVGDRLWAVRTPKGKYGAGKSTPRFASTRDLRLFSSRYDGEVPCIAFPGGERWRGDDPGVHEALSKALGKDVTLATEENVPLLDAGPGIVHLVTTASLAHARALLPDSVIDVRRFRPNILLDTAEATGPVEDAWVGRTLAVGEARFEVVERTERCVMVNHDREGLPYDGRILKTFRQSSGMCFGIYAKVIRPGGIRTGDRAALLD
ncbi:MOSC domain-containing protein [Streptomyces sp. NPDC059080]|uniref:MOSC domain-containing protein n=1 Tax=Streptomyces sp. NPDC059080 TaxID=3346718 RepID=UPI0036A5ED9C